MENRDDGLQGGWNIGIMAPIVGSVTNEKVVLNGVKQKFHVQKLMFHNNRTKFYFVTPHIKGEACGRRSTIFKWQWEKWINKIKWDIMGILYNDNEWGYITMITNGDTMITNGDTMTTNEDTMM